MVIKGNSVKCADANLDSSVVNLGSLFPKAIHRIMFVCPGGIGDCIRFSGLVRSVNAVYPEADFQLLTSSPAAASVCLEQQRWQRIWTLDKNSGKLRKLITTIRMRFAKPQLLIAAAGVNPEKTLALAGYAGIKLIVGGGAAISKSQQTAVGKFTAWVEAPANRNEYDLNDAIAERLLGPEYVLPPAVRVPAAVRASVQQRLGTLLPPTKSPRLAIHIPEPKMNKPRWGISPYIDVFRLVMQQQPEYVFVLLGNTTEKHLPKREKLQAFPNVIDLAGELSILETAAVLQEMDAFLGEDSSLCHLAAVTGLPSTVIFGNTDEKRNAPRGARIISQPCPCRPCYQPGRPLVCRHSLACLSAITPEEVSASVLDQNSLPKKVI